MGKTLSALTANQNRPGAKGAQKKQNDFMELYVKQKGRSHSLTVPKDTPGVKSAPAPAPVLYDDSAFKRCKTETFFKLTELKRKNAQLRAEIADLSTPTETLVEPTGTQESE